MPRLTALVLAGCLAVLAVAATVVDAQSTRPAASPFTKIRLSATTKQGSFAGRLDILGFRTRSGALVAAGRVSGRLHDERYPEDVVVTNLAVTVPVTLAAAPASYGCAAVRLVLTPGTFPVEGLTATVVQRAVDVRASRGAARALRELMCGTSRAVPSSPSAQSQANLLNATRLLYR